MIEERYRTLKYQNSIVTYSSELGKSGYVKDLQFIDLFSEIDTYMDKFITKILNVYNQKSIIIHKAFMLDDYIDKNGEKVLFDKVRRKNNKILNKKLKYLYNYLEKKLPNAYIIDICHKYSALENHIWGLAPMHYQDEYYDEAYKLIHGFLI